MNPDIQEVLLLSEADLDVRVRRLLRPGERLSVDFEDGCWAASIMIGEGESTKFVWDSVAFEKRLLLLDAYGWCWSREQTASAPPVWTRRREVTAAGVGRRASRGEPFPDPEDLDPREVASVYAPHHHGKKV